VRAHPIAASLQQLVHAGAGTTDGESIGGINSTHRNLDVDELLDGPAFENVFERTAIASRRSVNCVAQILARNLALGLHLACKQDFLWGLGKRVERLGARAELRFFGGNRPHAALIGEQIARAIVGGPGHVAVLMARLHGARFDAREDCTRDVLGSLLGNLAAESFLADGLDAQRAHGTRELPAGEVFGWRIMRCSQAACANARRLGG